MKLEIVKLGRIDYGEALDIQEKLHGMRQRGEVGDILLLLEHPPVLTLGRRGQHSNILLQIKELEKLGVRTYEVNRGGDVTYHGPGQIVGYPIMDLACHGRDVKDYVWKIEEVFIGLLKDQYGITAYRDDGKYTGVWVDNSKITAIGIAVRRWVTMHGFAFNVNTNLEHFKWITPCGITDKGVTSLQKILGRSLDFELVNSQVAESFGRVFGMEPEEVEIKALLRE